MEMKGEYRIPATRQRVWEALNDPDILKDCIPGCQDLEMVSDTEMTATVVSKIGPVKAKFTGAVTLSNLNPPDSYTISGEGKGGVAGFAKGGADVKLAEDGTDTVLTYEAKAQVGGKLAQLGSRLIDSTAKKMADDFFGKFAETVGGTAPQADDQTEEHGEGVIAEAVHKVEEVAETAAQKTVETVKEAEEVVEEAAARGLFGGAMMWGWIALAAIIIIILLLNN